MPAHLVAIHAGHHDVEQDEIGWVFRGKVQPLAPAFGRGDTVSRALELGSHQREVLGVVIDHQDGRRTLLRHPAIALTSCRLFGLRSLQPPGPGSGC